LEHTYDRQLPLRLSIPECVTIVGCGGVGSWAALFLALAGVPQLILWDEDVLAEHNFNRFPCGPAAVGCLKVDAMRLHIEQVKPGCDVIARAENWSKANQSNSPIIPGWILVTTDTWASRKEVYEWVQCFNEGRDIRDNGRTYTGVSYIEASAEGEFGGAAGRPALFASELEENAGYASVPVWVGPAVIGAYLAVAYILHDTPLEAGHMWNIGWQQDNQIKIQHLP
jgi:ThiF family